MINFLFRSARSFSGMALNGFVITATAPALLLVSFVTIAHSYQEKCVSGGDGVTPCISGGSDTWSSESGAAEIGRAIGTAIREFLFGGNQRPAPAPRVDIGATARVEARDAVRRANAAWAAGNFSDAARWYERALQRCENFCSDQYLKVLR